MNIQSRSAGRAAVLELSGRFDSYSAPSVATWLEKTTAVPAAHVVVNLSGVNFMDSTALATLVQASKRCRQQNGELHLCGLQPQVYIIFELTRLDKVFNIFVDEDHAIQAFGN